jgi:hypothetical protein
MCVHSPHTTVLQISVIPLATANIRLTQRTVISWHLTRRAATLIRNPTDTTHVLFFLVFVRVISVVANVPFPLCDCIPVFNSEFHSGDQARQVQ